MVKGIFELVFNYLMGEVVYYIFYQVVIWENVVIIKMRIVYDCLVRVNN